MKHGKRLIFAAFIVCTNPIYAASYTIDYMGSLDQWSIGNAINDKGEVTGMFLNEYGNSGDTQYYGFSYKNGTFQSLGFPENGGSLGRSINSSGQIVGDLFTHSDRYAAKYNNGTITPIPGLGENGGMSLDINNAGTIVGVSYSLNSHYLYGFIYQDGVIENIGNYLWPMAINNSGEISGFSNEFTSFGNRQDSAFVYQNGQIDYLGTLGGRESFAFDINDSGQIIGWATNAEEMRRPFIYQDEKMIEIGNLSSNGEAVSINNLGDIVGIFYQANGSDRRAFVFHEGVFSDLNDLVTLPDGWVLHHANGINDSGQIIATGINGDGAQHAFLLTPTAVPLPNAVWLMLTGLLSLCGQRKKSVNRGVGLALKTQLMD
jgi:probable HAF family extracellular repeat protein